MKNLILLAAILATTLLTGCMQSRYITERYIKNNIEEHIEGKNSKISTYTILQKMLNTNRSYIEFTGYKYNEKKGLIIGADAYYLLRQKTSGNNTILKEVVYIELTVEQCQAILTNYKLLKDKIKEDDPIIYEAIYRDYTVSDDLFIGYKKTTNSSSSNIDFWVKGEKYTIPTNQVMRKLKKFIKYSEF